MATYEFVHLAHSPLQAKQTFPCAAQSDNHFIWPALSGPAGLHGLWHFMSSSCPKVATITYCLTASANACLWERKSITFCLKLLGWILFLSMLSVCLFVCLAGWEELNHAANNSHWPWYIPCFPHYPLPFLRSAFPLGVGKIWPTHFARCTALA